VSAGRLKELSEQYGQTVEFLTVYIREAHPLDGVLPERQTGRWLMGSPERRLFVEDPITFEERLGLARRCEEEMALGFPTLVDDLEDTASRAYAAWPERLFMIDLDGTIAYRGDIGPDGFLPDQLGRVLERCSNSWARGEPAGEMARLRGKSKTKRPHERAQGR
jgi:hypothetical protein